MTLGRAALDIHVQQGPTAAYLVFSPHRGRWQHPNLRLEATTDGVEMSPRSCPCQAIVREPSDFIGGFGAQGLSAVACSSRYTNFNCGPHFK